MIHGDDAGRRRQSAIYVDGARGVRPRVPVAPAALEAAAARVLPPDAHAYLAGGAGQERTMAADRAGFAARRLVPRVLRDVSARDTTVTLFGRTLPAPVFTCPIGVLELAHPEADVAVGRAAARHGIPMTFSSQASIAMETVAAAMGDAPRWFQLYFSRSRALVESFVARAERCGCEAIVLTLDTTMLGWRPRDLDLASLPFLQGMGLAQYTSDPVFARLAEEVRRAPAPPAGSVTAAALATLAAQARRHPGGTLGNVASGRARAAVRTFVETYSNPALSWDDVAWLRTLTRLPLVLKGILHPDDARRAVDAGVDAIQVSTHGGRQVDGAIGAMAALPAVVAAVAGRVPVLLDSGVRSGADVALAVAQGATAVGIGRPWVWGLALAGEAGVHQVLADVVAEFDLTMGLAGCRTVAELREATLA